VQNFAQGEAGESRDKVAERLDWARRLEQVERLKARERQGERTDLNIRKNFSGSETGITPRMREQTPYGKFSGGRSGDHPAHAGTDIQENFPGSELVPFPE
jgi:hypothetical protein